METDMQTIPNIKSERGQTFTEFALVLPILIVLMLGIVQFGVVFNNYVTLTNAVRAGARTGVVSRSSPNPTKACVDQVRTSAANLKQSDLTVSCTSSWQVGTDVTVTASYPYGIKLLNWLVVSGNLNSTMKERVE
jgi:Flp pilus assembly protein TadG